jgi:glycosyltransferase involved in cell wall biosynthesis
MRICIAQRITLAHPVKGGMERHLHLLASGLAARGHDVHVITTAHPAGLAEEVEGGVHLHYLSPYSYRRYQPAWWRASYAHFAALQAQQPFDLFCSQSAGGLGYLHRLKREHDIAVVVVVHATLWGAVLTHIRGARSARGLARLARLAWVLPGHYRLWRTSASAVDRYIAVSQEVAEGWQHELRLRPEQVVVVPNGVDTGHFYPSPEKRAQARQRLGLSPDRPVLLYVGRLESEKGVHLAVRALKEQPAEPVLLIAGAGHYGSTLHHLAAQLGLTERVRFLGFVGHEELPDLLNAADIFVMPSLCQEGLPLSVVEAMACGLPVVATAVGGIPTAVEDNVSGALFPLGDVAALSERLRRLIEAPQLRHQLGAAARARAEARFSQAQMAAAYEAVFAAVLRKDGKQRTKEYAI